MENNEALARFVTTQCDSDNGVHLVDWTEVPAMLLNGRKVRSAMYLGVCLLCGEKFTVRKVDVR